MVRLMNLVDSDVISWALCINRLFVKCFSSRDVKSWLYPSAPISDGISKTPCKQSHFNLSI